MMLLLLGRVVVVVAALLILGRKKMLLLLLRLLQWLLLQLLLLVMVMLVGFGFVSLHVQGEMVAAGEASVADLALEGFGAGVFSNVAREFVGAREPPQTVFVRARVWLFTWKEERGRRRR